MYWVIFPMLYAEETNNDSTGKPLMAEEYRVAQKTERLEWRSQWRNYYPGPNMGWLIKQKKKEPQDLVDKVDVTCEVEKTFKEVMRTWYI